MGIKISGATNTITEIVGDQVVFENSMYINNKIYIFPGAIVDSPDYPPYYEGTYATTFEISYPENTSISSSEIKIGETIKNGSIITPSKVILAYYNIEYTEGNSQYTAKITLTPKDAIGMYDNSEQPISYFELFLGKTHDAGNPKKTIKFTYIEQLVYSERVVLSEQQHVENLLINKNALINNNLAIIGQINNVQFYYDTYYTNTPITDIGFGFYAQFYDSKYTVNNIEYELPFFQLSPGLSYTTNNIIVSWLANGQLILQSITSDPITNISFAPKILRYE